MSLKITVLLNNPGKEHVLKRGVGLSLLLNDNDKKIIFNTGSDDSYIRNAKAVGAKLNDVDYVVLSHQNYHHFSGLPYLISKTDQRIEVVCHPHFFKERYSDMLLTQPPVKIKTLSDKVSRSALIHHFNFKFTCSPLTIGRNFMFIGEIKMACGEVDDGLLISGSHYKTNSLTDQSALIWLSGNGLVIVVSYCHSSICEVIEYAKTLTGENRILAVIGSLHLNLADVSEILRIRRFFKRQKISEVYLCCRNRNLGRFLLPKAKMLHTGQRLTFTSAKSSFV